MSSHLEDVLPPPQTLVVADEAVDVSPLRVGELVAIRPLLSGLSLPLLPDGAPDLLGLLSGDQVEKFLDALALAARRERAWVDTLAVDDAVCLAAAVVEANADFFVRRILPAAEKGAEGVRKAIGQMSANG